MIAMGAFTCSLTRRAKLSSGPTTASTGASATQPSDLRFSSRPMQYENFTSGCGSSSPANGAYSFTSLARESLPTMLDCPAKMKTRSVVSSCCARATPASDATIDAATNSQARQCEKRRALVSAFMSKVSTRRASSTISCAELLRYRAVLASRPLAIVSLPPDEVRRER